MVSYTSSSPLLPGFFNNVPLIAEVVACDSGESNAVNVAEISSATDDNDEDLDDADSTPDNNDPSEDDQDDASVTIVTGAVIGDYVLGRHRW